MLPRYPIYYNGDKIIKYSGHKRIIYCVMLRFYFLQKKIILFKEFIYLFSLLNNLILWFQKLRVCRVTKGRGASSSLRVNKWNKPATRQTRNYEEPVKSVKFALCWKRARTYISSGEFCALFRRHNGDRGAYQTCRWHLQGLSLFSHILLDNNIYLL